MVTVGRGGQWIASLSCAGMPDRRRAADVTICARAR